METLGYGWAVILGLVQGVTEFLPVSSSGHLALAEHIGLGRPLHPFFDVMLHAATLLAVLAFFWRAALWYYRNDRIALLYVLAGSVPAGLAGLAFRDRFEALRHSPNMICLGLLVTAAFLSMAELAKSRPYQLRDLGWFGAFFVGLCQALAISPGISRSGMTIAGAMLCGIDKEESFRFSFILSVPVVCGAVFLGAARAAGDYGGAGAMPPLPVGPAVAGFVAAGVSGYFALGLLREIVVRDRLVWFAGYCCLAAAAGLVYFNLFQ